MVDLKAYYEHIEPADDAVGGSEQGLPWSILALTTHLDLGPRRIRVGGAVSRKVFPRRSVLAGCTWATTHVRLHVLKPAQKFIDESREHLQGWGINIDLKMYIDDAAMVLWGDLNPLARMFTWASA